MEEEEIPEDTLISEARALIEAALHSTSDERTDQLYRWARAILEPLVEARIPAAQWVYSALGSAWSAGLDDEQFEREYWRRVREAAKAGVAGAQFELACELDTDGTEEESAALFRAAAEQGHSYAKWVHGLNLLSGRGLPQDREQGLALIQQAAEEKFEGAIQFMSQAYAHGDYGLPRDEALAAEWWKRLSDPKVIRF